MRKTLTVISIVIAAASLGACKMFWERDPAPAAVATAPTTPDGMTTAEAPKPTDQTASMSTDKPAYGEKKAETPPVLATK